MYTDAGRGNKPLRRRMGRALDFSANQSEGRDGICLRHTS